MSDEEICESCTNCGADVDKEPTVLCDECDDQDDRSADLANARREGYAKALEDSASDGVDLWQHGYEAARAQAIARCDYWARFGRSTDSTPEHALDVAADSIRAMRPEKPDA